MTSKDVANRWLFPDLREHVLRRPEANGEGNTFKTPSMRDGGISWETERKLRFTTCAFVEDLAQVLEMPSAPAVTAQLYVQRFYMMHSFSQHDRFLVATAAVFLAGKMEEFPIKVRLVTECSLFLLNCKPEQPREQIRAKPASKKRKPSLGHTGDGKPGDGPTGSSLSNNPEAAHVKHLDCLNALLEVIDVGVVESTSAKVLLMERILLQTIAFDLALPEPFSYVAPAMHKVFTLEAMHFNVTHSGIRATAFLFLADAVKSTLTMAFNANELAIGAVYLACLHLNQVSRNVATAQNEPWWSVWGLSAADLEDVARALLWMYEDEQGVKKPNLSDGLRELWDRYRPDQNMPDLEFIKKLDANLIAE
ncbi:TPA: hypothetical protein N0F65_007104 [Lagenidium giganteum]|uniref:Cyclin-like domain-containing protein n=1 Tax=Lagenidium giganteum TaxID=4803 RepID=A0AAV2YJI5_9STRA|nr:TPA: hypothetical protein N0F65_007104 [Lagenidium giganteum]